MAFDPAKLTRLSGPLATIFPQENQAQYWAYRTDEGIDDVTNPGFFPAGNSVLVSDYVVVFSGGPPWEVFLINIYEDS